MPVYIFSMIIGVYFLDGTPAGNWQMAWSNLLYINNYIRDSYMGWTWSLAIEEQFYFLVAITLVISYKCFKTETLQKVFLILFKEILIGRHVL